MVQFVAVCPKPVAIMMEYEYFDFEVCVFEVFGLWSAFLRSVFSRHPQVEVLASLYA